MKLDLGCGDHKKEGFFGVDTINFPGVDLVLDVGVQIWPWEDGSIEYVYCSHLLEHLATWERVHFANELYRVLQPDGKCQLTCPHWASCRAYGDPTHVWPPVSEFWFYYLDKQWRKENAPHTDFNNDIRGFKCDLEVTWGYSMRADVLMRNQEYQNFAMANYKDACLDMIATMGKKKR